MALAWLKRWILFCDKEPAKWERAKSLISCLPPTFTHDLFGIDVLIWSAATTNDRKIQNAHLDELEVLYDQQKGLIKTAGAWALQGGPPKVKAVLAQYSLGVTLRKHEPSESVPLTILKNNAAPGVKLSDERVKSYTTTPAITFPGFIRGLVAGYDNDFTSQAQYAPYLDTPTGLILAHKGRPCAIVGFGAAGDSEMMIKQIQGIRGQEIDFSKFPGDGGYVIKRMSSRGLAPLNWRNLIVDLAARIAYEAGFTKLSIQSGENNPLATVEPTHFSLESAKSIYDRTAQALQFTRGLDGNWHIGTEAYLETRLIA